MHMYMCMLRERARKICINLNEFINYIAWVSKASIYREISSYCLRRTLYMLSLECEQERANLTLNCKTNKKKGQDFIQNDYKINNYEKKRKHFKCSYVIRIVGIFITFFSSECHYTWDNKRDWRAERCQWWPWSQWPASNATPPSTWDSYESWNYE